MSKKPTQAGAGYRSHGAARVGRFANRFIAIVSRATDMSADQIHQVGLDEVARIRAEMEALKGKVGFKGDLKAFFKFVDTDPPTDPDREPATERNTLVPPIV